MVHYEPVKVTIDASALAQVIIDIVLRHHDLVNLIITDQCSVFTSKFWLFLCHLLKIIWKISTIFYTQIHGQIERELSIMEA